MQRNLTVFTYDARNTELVEWYFDNTSITPSLLRQEFLELKAMSDNFEFGMLTDLELVYLDEFEEIRVRVYNPSYIDDEYKVDYYTLLVNIDDNLRTISLQDFI